MAQYIVIDSNSNVVNVIVWDGVTPWSPPEGYTAHLFEGAAHMGGKWDGTTVLDPAPPTPPKPRPTSGNVHVIAD